MKKFITAIALLLAVGCGSKGPQGDQGVAGTNGQDGTSCHVEDGMYGAVIICEDGSSQDIFDGKDGVDGKDGSNGVDGVDGVNGLDGVDGKDGINGTSCTIESLEGGAEIVCGSSSVVVSNGVDGKDGLNAASVSIIDPCPTMEVDYPELMLKIGDMYVAYFQDGQMEFLTVLKSGVKYQTTDGRACIFQVP